MSGGEGGGFTPQHDPDMRLPVPIVVSLIASGMLLVGGLGWFVWQAVRWVVR